MHASLAPMQQVSQCSDGGNVAKKAVFNYWKLWQSQGETMPMLSDACSYASMRSTHGSSPEEEVGWRAYPEERPCTTSQYLPNFVSSSGHLLCVGEKRGHHGITTPENPLPG